jgi:chromosome segregation ATPase
LIDNYRTYHLGELKDLKDDILSLQSQFDQVQRELVAQNAITQRLEQMAKQARLSEGHVKERLREISLKLGSRRKRFGEIEGEMFDLPEDFDDWNREQH